MPKVGWRRWTAQVSLLSTQSQSFSQAFVCDMWLLSDETGETDLAPVSVLHCGCFSSVFNLTQQPSGFTLDLYLAGIIEVIIQPKLWREVAPCVELEEE